MANEIDILLGGNMTPQNTETDLMAQALRGQLQEGNVLGMSTIRGVSDFGKQQAQAARAGAREAGRLKQALEKEARDEERAAQKEARAFKQWEKKQKRLQQDKMDFEKFKDELTDKDEKPKSNKLKPTGKAVQDYTKSRQLSNLISSVGADFDKMNKTQKNMLDNPEADLATDLLLPAAAERYVQDKFIYDDPQVKNYRAKLADIESEFSRLMSGLAVTGFEMKDRQKWSPYATGISQDTRVQRLQNLSEKLKGQQDLSEQTYELGNIAGYASPEQGMDMATESVDDSKTVTMAELQAMGATPEEAAAAGYKVVQ